MIKLKLDIKGVEVELTKEEAEALVKELEQFLPKAYQAPLFIPDPMPSVPFTTLPFIIESSEPLAKGETR